MFQRILVPLDGSDGSERAIPVAARIAHASGGSLVFIRVVPAPAEVGTFGAGARGTIAMKPEIEASEKELANAASYLAAIIAAYADELAGIETAMDVAAGAASPIIFSTAHNEHVDLVVMCSHGETGLKRWVLGSVAQQAVRRSPVPVLVLNEQGNLPAALSAVHSLRVLVPLDGSALAEAAVEPAAQLIAALAAPAQCEVHLLRIVDLPSAYGSMKSQAHLSDSMQQEARQEAQRYVQAMAERLRATTFATCKLHLTWSVAVSPAVAATIIKQAEQTGSSDGYDVIAIATHGRGGLKRLVMGSVTEHLLGSTKLPLLIVRPQQTESRGEEEEQGETIEARGTGAEMQTWPGLL
jgi:nucleotide-binding universal stress UspA family protein